MKKKVSTPHGDAGIETSCEIRCMDPDAVEVAMNRLDADGVERVPYTCQLSGDKAKILLLGNSLASRLAEMMPEAGDADGAKILAGLYATELCECDVAALTRLPEAEVVDRLRAFTAHGVLARRILHGMHYFRLESESVRHQIEELVD